MTTELAPFRQHAPGQPKVPTAQPEAVRRAMIPTRIVPMKTVYMELSLNRGSFEDKATEAQCERHPEWYIG